MKNLFLLLSIPLFFLSCIEVEKEVEKDLEVVIVEFGDLTSLSDDKQYGNFEIKVPEIDVNPNPSNTVYSTLDV